MKKSRNVCRGKKRGERRRRTRRRRRRRAADGENCCPKLSGCKHNRASKRASTCCPRAGAASEPLVAPQSLHSLLTASASGWGCWRESKWNSKWKNVSRFAAQAAALKEIIFSYKQTHTRTDRRTHSTHTHTHARTDIRTLRIRHGAPIVPCVVLAAHIQSG